MTVLNPPLKHNKRKKRISGVILHHTAGGSAESTIDWLRKPTVRASYHYIIERNGEVYKCVPYTLRAWHSGISKGKYGGDVNSQTIGIAFANKGNGEPYPERQVNAAHNLVHILNEVLDLDWISTHRLITTRKVDPFAFDFEAFAAEHDLEKFRSVNREWNG